MICHELLLLLLLLLLIVVVVVVVVYFPGVTTLCVCISTAH